MDNIFGMKIELNSYVPENKVLVVNSRNEVEKIIDIGNQLSSKIELVSCLDEAIKLMEDIREGTYKPDSFTTQPWKLALAKYRKKNG